MINFINQINKKKIIFNSIKPRKILFLDNGYLQIKKKIQGSFTLDNNCIYVVPLINAFLKSFYFNKRKLRVIYFWNLIKSFKPKVIVSNDYDAEFQK